MKYEVTVYFMDMDEDPTTPFEEEEYVVEADSEKEALRIAKDIAYDSKHSIGTNLSVEVII